MRYKIYYSKGLKFFGELAVKNLGFERYNPKTDQYKPVLFCGLYFPQDYEVFREHHGRKAVFWNGTDVEICVNNPAFLALVKSFVHCKHACHNQLLSDELKSVGIPALIRPIFFSKIEDYPVSFQKSEPFLVYSMAHPGREEEYGIGIIKKLAPQTSGILFHIYGINKEDTDKIIYHGQVPEAVMDREIRGYHCCLRLNQHDGFSQTLLKSVLLGQYSVSCLKYEHIDYLDDKNLLPFFLDRIKCQSQPNFDARNFWLEKLNNFDWLENIENGLSLVMIAKNEGKGIEKAIQSCVEFVDNIVISVDKSSTDDTLKIASKYADILKIHEWHDNFSEIRNSVQQAAKTKWVLILDGHEFVKEIPALTKALHSDYDSFFAQVKLENNFVFWFPRIMLRSVIWENAVHNNPVVKATCRLHGFIVQHDRSGLQSSESREVRDKQRKRMITDIFTAQLRKNRKDEHAAFYLAQFYFYNNENKKAIKYYRHFLKYSKNKEERWLVLYECGNACNLLNWPNKAIKYYLLANREIPGRWEINKRIGTTLIILKKYFRAAEYFVESFEVSKLVHIYNPEQRNFAQIWYFISECFTALNNFDKAKIAAKEALAENLKNNNELLPEEQVKILNSVLGV
jgi:glycosyltransferase involved in cell wall biosynthesis